MLINESLYHFSFTFLAKPIKNKTIQNLTLESEEKFHTGYTQFLKKDGLKDKRIGIYKLPPEITIKWTLYSIKQLKY